MSTKEQMQEVLRRYCSDDCRLTFCDGTLIGADALRTFLERMQGEFNPPLRRYIDLESYPEKVIQRSDAILAVTPDGSLSGMTVFYLRNRRTEYAHWTFLGVLKAYRACGVAGRLTEAMIACCRDAGVPGILGQTWETHEKILRFITPFGFHPYGELEPRPHTEEKTLKFRLDFEG